MSSKLRLAVLIVCLSGVCVYAGIELLWPRMAHYLQSRQEARIRAEVDALCSRLVMLDQEYLDGDVEKARRSLHEAVQLIETASCLRDEARARGLAGRYGRLHMLETRVGDSAAAAGYWIKVQYWLLRMGEATGTRHWAAEEVQKVTPESNIAELNEWDRTRTNGRGPMYARYIDN